MDQFRPAVTGRRSRREAALAPGVLAATLLLAMAVGGCVSSAPGAADDLGPAEALALDVLDAVADNDLARMENLALTEEEFRTIVWPKLPASRREVGMPADYLWTDLSTKSRAHLHDTLARVAGKRFELVDVEFEGETTDYETFRVRRRSVLRVRTGDGRVQRLRVFGSMIELDRRVKVFSYVVD
jgi:hypothetical protein